MKAGFASANVAPREAAQENCPNAGRQPLRLGARRPSHHNSNKVGSTVHPIRLRLWRRHGRRCHRRSRRSEVLIHLGWVGPEAESIVQSGPWRTPERNPRPFPSLPQSDGPRGQVPPARSLTRRSAVRWMLVMAALGFQRLNCLLLILEKFWASWAKISAMAIRIRLPILKQGNSW